ncbi:MAG: hypothetical protein ACYCU0_04720 [Solirubrobacteraceae bacterium]
MPDTSPTTPAKRTRRDLVRIGALVVLGVLITLFAVLNLKAVRVDWIFGSSKAPLIIVIVVSVLIGGALTYLGERRIRRR